MRVCAVIVAIVCSLAAAAMAEAQSTRRPDLNIFKRALRDPRQSLGISGNLGANFFDTLIRPDLPPGEAPVQPDHGWGSFASASLAYNLKLNGLSVGASLGGYATYYPDLADPFRANVFPNAAASTGYSWNLTEKTTASVGASLGVSPIYSAALTPNFGGSDPSFGGGSAGFIPSEAAFIDGNYFSTSVLAGLRHELSRRWHVTADYGFGRELTFGVDDPGQYDGLWRQEAGTALHYSLASNVSVRGGYRYSESHSNDEVHRTHSADVGIDYGDGLVIQIARRTTLNLSAGASGYVDRAGSQRYAVTGGAQLSHGMGRTWSSGAYYERSLDSSELFFTEPVLGDSAGASLNGLMTRRTGFHATASWQGGFLAFGSPNSDIFRSSFNTGIQTAFGRNLALSVDYVAYRYDFDEDVPLPSNVPRRGASQGVYVQLNAWAPIFQSGGRSNATR